MDGTTAADTLGTIGNIAEVITFSAIGLLFVGGAGLLVVGLVELLRNSLGRISAEAAADRMAVSAADGGDMPSADGEPRDVPELVQTVYIDALGSSVPAGVAAWLIADVQAEWAARRTRPGGGNGGGNGSDGGTGGGMDGAR